MTEYELGINKIRYAIENLTTLLEKRLPIQQVELTYAEKRDLIEELKLDVEIKQLRKLLVEE